MAVSQEVDVVEIVGQVESEASIADIHIINKTNEKFAVSNSEGKFVISAKLQDTLLISSVQHKLKTVYITEQIIHEKKLVVTLEIEINALDEIILGRILTGDIDADIGNMGNTPVTSMSVGIKSYTGKPKTPSERRLNEATTGGGIIPLNPIINAINGRTKQLKAHILFEEKDALLFKIRAKFSEDFFITYPLDEDLRMDFFYFCSDDLNFLKRCKNRTDFGILIYLTEKYEAYMKNLSLDKD
jgi:hypothetical protein